MRSRARIPRLAPVVRLWPLWLVSLVWLGSVRPARAEIVDRIVAIIDREVVTLSEAEQAIAIARVRSGERPALVDVVERLIEARLVEREVERFSDEPVPTELVDAAVEELRSRFEDDESFLSALGKSGLTQESLRSELRRQLSISRYLERRFRSLTFVSDEQVEAYYRDELPSLVGSDPLPPLPEVSDSIRSLLEERTFNHRVDEWIAQLKARSHIRRYVW